MASDSLEHKFTGGCDTGCLNPNSDPPQEQQMLFTAKPYVQHSTRFLFGDNLPPILPNHFNYSFSVTCAQEVNF